MGPARWCTGAFALALATSVVGCATQKNAPSRPATDASSSSSRGAPKNHAPPPAPAPQYLTDDQEEELATLLTRALVSDEEHKSRAQDEGRFGELIALMTKDLTGATAKDATDATRARAARAADARLMDVMKRRAPDVALIMEENQRHKRCRRMSDVARLRLRAFFVSQELFRADHNRYGLLSELPKEALPAPRERKIFQFDLVKSSNETFLYRATGRGDSIAAGTMWEIDHMGIAQEVIAGCKPNRKPSTPPETIANE